MAEPRSIDFDAFEAAGLCECGTPLDGHPPLLEPLPWNYGRPCSKTSLQRGYGWDGREMTVRTPGHVKRWTGYGTGLVRASR